MADDGHTINPGPTAAQLRELLTTFVSFFDEPCRYDHNGDCQAHMLEPVGECTVAIAVAVLLQPSPEGECRSGVPFPTGDRMTARTRSNRLLAARITIGVAAGPLVVVAVTRGDWISVALFALILAVDVAWQRGHRRERFLCVGTVDEVTWNLSAPCQVVLSCDGFSAQSLHDARNHLAWVTIGEVPRPAPSLLPLWEETA
jgi:hypothetical protein